MVDKIWCGQYLFQSFGHDQLSPIIIWHNGKCKVGSRHRFGLEDRQGQISLITSIKHPSSLPFQISTRSSVCVKCKYWQAIASSYQISKSKIDLLYGQGLFVPSAHGCFHFHGSSSSPLPKQDISGQQTDRRRPHISQLDMRPSRLPEELGPEPNAFPSSRRTMPSG